MSSEPQGWRWHIRGKGDLTEEWAAGVSRPGNADSAQQVRDKAKGDKAEKKDGKRRDEEK